MWHHEVDVICVGSGLGGLTGALAAHEAGQQVLILEKSDKLGGVCAYSGGEVFVCNNHLMAAAGKPDDPVQGRAYLDFLAGGYSVPELADVLYERAPEAAKWLQETCDIRWKIIEDFPDYHYPHAPGTVRHGRYLECELFDAHQLGDWRKKAWQTPHMPPGIIHDELFAWGGLACIMQWDFALMGQRLSEDKRGMGPGMMGWFVKAAQVDRKIPTWLDCPLTKLVVEDGRVVGVECSRGGGTVRVRARKGVLMAIGGYDWHPDFPKYYEGLPEWNSMCQPTIEGDNLILGGEVGAALAGVPSYNLGMFFGYQLPGEQQCGRPMYRASWEGGYPHALWVNRAGERFADESFYREYLPRCHDWDGVAQAHPNYPPYLIFDSTYRSKYAFATYMPGMDIPETVCARGDTPRELAEKLGIDADAFEETLARFNSFADGEVDPDFGRGRYPWAAMMTGDHSRPNPNMGPLDQRPYYGIALTAVGVGVNAVGLRINTKGQVMHVRGHAIEGLYAAGNTAALLDTGAGYQSGISNARGMTWGYVAARHMAGLE